MVKNTRNLPEIWPGSEPWEVRREQIVRLLCEEVYGFPPPPPVNLSWEELSIDDDFCAGKAALRKILLKAELENGAVFMFPINVIVPASKTPVPFFVLANFVPEVPNKKMPVEEIIDNGFGILSFCYEDVSLDRPDFHCGVGENCGKIALWAWANSRVMDYAFSLPELDKARGTVIGHSRLGKTALLTGALDTRFSCAVSIQSGCCGAAVFRGKKGERISDSMSMFPYWYKQSFAKYAGSEESLPFDQHFFLAACAPRKVYVASAKQDEWADPESEHLSCVMASEVWERLGLPGFTQKGSIGYHNREGTHYFGREDWLCVMDYLKSAQ